MVVVAVVEEQRVSRGGKDIDEMSWTTGRMSSLPSVATKRPSAQLTDRPENECEPPSEWASDGEHEWADCVTD